MPTYTWRVPVASELDGSRGIRFTATRFSLRSSLRAVLSHFFLSMKYIVAGIAEETQHIFRVFTGFIARVGTLAIFYDPFYSGDERYFSSGNAQGIAPNPM